MGDQIACKYWIAQKKICSEGRNTICQSPAPLEEVEEVMFTAISTSQAPPLASSESDSDTQLELELSLENRSRIALMSSGYGSSLASSESDPETNEQVGGTGPDRFRTESIWIVIFWIKALSRTGEDKISEPVS
uniref:Uncharacterized protein n=1 Tax=Angiostrongylus cantonensis TaxID=6313 RepID=A0A0K0DK38_ANGCA